MKKHQLLLIAIALLGFQFVTKAQTSGKTKRIYTTNTVKGLKPPVIDGILDDESWKSVPWATGFIENEPDENTAPTYQTRFKIVYDAKYLYFAVQALDPNPEKIESRLSRRDGFQGDRINLLIDSYHDKRTAFVFTVTAAGVKGDEIVTNDGGNIDNSWNPVWYTKAVINEEGWSAEMKIPLSQLRFGSGDDLVWGMNVVRNIFRKNETSLWSRVPAGSSGFVSQSGELHGLKNLKSQKQLEIQPFTVFQYDTYPATLGNPFKDGSDFKMNGGIDAKIGITNDLTLDLTINPDFGQVEADPGSFSLDGFQIFLEEKRPFFVENKNIFDYQFANGQDNVFYSRRIGRAPHGYPSLGSGEYADVPNNTTILGAAKFSGKTESGWSIGILESITAKEFAEIDNNGTRSEEIVEPLTNYLVLRTQKDFNNNNSYIGGIFTATNRNLEGYFNYLHESAYTGGIDFKHSWKNRNYFLEGNFIASKVSGSAQAIEKTQRSLTHLFQRVDASHLDVDPTRTSLTGTGGKISAGKSGGGNWRYNGGIVWRSPELELNDIGFLRQADEIAQNATISFQTLKPTKQFRKATIEVKQTSTYDYDGNYNRFQVEMKSNFIWKNNWWTVVGLGHKPRIFITTFLRGGPRWRFSEENFAYLFFGSDQSKKANFSFGMINSAAKQNNFSFKRYEFKFNYQPINSLSLSLETAFGKNPNRTQYVSEKSFGATQRYILGEIDQQTWSTSLRVNYSINPNLSVQFYGSPFITRGRYSNFNFVKNASAENLNDRVTWYTSNQITQNGTTFSIDENTDSVTDYEFRKPDFTFAQFRSNLVIRWEYIPGSEMFLVWSRGATGTGNINDPLSSTVNSLIFDKKADDTFLFKLTYRFLR